MTVFFCIRVISSWIFHSQIPLTHFYSCFFFFAIYCHLLSFLNNHKILLSLTFALYISNLFHHKYIDKSFSKGNKKQVSLQNQFPCKTSFPLQNQFPSKTSVPAKPVSLETNIGCRSSLSL